jgi:CRISPR-associated exonuclease Cas4
MHLPRGTFTVPAVSENHQSAEAFADEQSRLEAAFERIRWIRPSDADLDLVPIQVPPALGDEEPLQPPSTIEGSRLRGVILHKLMEELLTGEIGTALDAVKGKARVLLDQLSSTTHSGMLPDPSELASTALRTLTLPELEPFRTRLIPEVSIYGVTPKSMDQLIAGRADAVGWKEDGSKVVFDWKSDVVPNNEDRAAYRQQLSQYLHVIGAARGAIVYMTSGRLDWVIA